MRERARTGLFALGGLAVLVGLWAIAARALANPILLPVPGALWSGLRETLADGTLARDVAASLKRVLFGFGLAAGTAVPLALAVVSVRPLQPLVLPVLALLRPIPPIAWIPIAILWFHVDDRAPIFLIFLASVFPIMVSAMAAEAS